MKKAEKETRAEMLELIEEYCSRIDNNGLLNVLTMAWACWKEAKRQEGKAAAAEAIRADSGKIIYLFGGDQSGQ